MNLSRGCKHTGSCFSKDKKCLKLYFRIKGKYDNKKEMVHLLCLLTFSALLHRCIALFTKWLPFLPHIQNNMNNWLRRSLFLLKTGLEFGEAIHGRTWKIKDVVHNAEAQTQPEENLNKNVKSRSFFLVMQVPLSNSRAETPQPVVFKPLKYKLCISAGGGGHVMVCTICYFRITDVNGIQRIKTARVCWR